MNTQDVKSYDRSELDDRIAKNNAMVQLEQLAKRPDVSVTFDFDDDWSLCVRGGRDMFMSNSENALHRLEQVYIKFCG